MMSQTLVCQYCQSPDIAWDAYVGVNDPFDVSTFDTCFCPECDGETTPVPIGV